MESGRVWWSLLGALAFAALLLVLPRLLRRGPQEFVCPGFFEHVTGGKGGRLIRDIQRDSRAPGSAALAGTPDAVPDPLALAIARAVGGDEKLAPARPDILLLSGGGQWGAYGAGLFEKLSENSGNHLALPGIGIVTGISTGSLQALLLMVALDPCKEENVRALAIERLVCGYNPKHERDIVRNTGMLGVPLFGSQAGTAALRRRIAHALRPAGGVSLVEEISNSTIAGFVGFVEAGSGAFRYVHVNALVKDVASEQAVERLTAATMASSAMPVFHQQVRVIDGAGAHALYDGGVRRSVFFDEAMEELDRQVCARVAGPGEPLTGAAFADSYRAAAPTVYVVRNGPTVRDRQATLDGDDGVIANARRGYDLLVNESEIGAIAALRLYNSHGDIFVTTADEYDDGADPAPCRSIKRNDMMFDPDFMDCLRCLGARKACREGGPWWPLGALDPKH